ncbi:chromate transporter [Celerinatantimonas diazotrophica]|uniref:Chromate transporter n=1 Tax=Celerinatantimonas diazotrophica TaxID=412034 RepID=A0A4R1J9Y1_9GAMM|nr:chromate transporter [Celerinatantimonas diazotrophica]TCK47436.1 chromate transporter [Celerinatantimonas diazotrophica]CAG9294946.1 Chromate transport protein [Celerinatantimonas diazotrophica]
MSTPALEPINITKSLNCRALFCGFMMLGMMGFGGVLPLAHRMLVERRQWLTDAQFTELLGLCQFLPGGNIINLSVAVGAKFRGIRGAISALFGLLLVPTIVVIGLSYIYQHAQDNLTVQHLFLGLMAAATGLLITTALKMIKPFLGNPRALFSITLTILFMIFIHLPLLAILVSLVSLNVWMQRGDYR